MWLELGKFVSLLISILCLYALFHTAFLMPADGFGERMIETLKMLVLAAGSSLASGWIFYRWERQTGHVRPMIAATLPMKVFWWASGAIAALFVVSWFLEAYYIPLRNSLLR